MSLREKLSSAIRAGAGVNRAKQSILRIWTLAKGGSRVYYARRALSAKVSILISPSRLRRLTQHRRPYSRLAGLKESSLICTTVSPPTTSALLLPQAHDTLANSYYDPMASVASAQPIALPSSSNNHDFVMGSGSHTGQNGSFNPASYTRRFMGSPISFRNGSFGSRFYPGVSPGQLLGPLE